MPADVEVLALDWTAITVGRFLAARYEGNPGRTRVEIGLTLAAVDEWFPVRTLVADTLQRPDLDAVDALDSWSALLLAAQLEGDPPRPRLGVAIGTDRRPALVRGEERILRQLLGYVAPTAERRADQSWMTARYSAR